MTALHWLAMAVFVEGLAISWLVWRVRQHQFDVLAWHKYRTAREKLLDHLADPAQIETEFESSAERMEALTHGRLTMPRPDAGPPAKVWRPKAMRSVMPRGWNPPSDYDSRLR